MDKSCFTKPAVEFVARYRVDAKIIADSLDLPLENILGLAAYESSYGAGRIASQNNNYFSMHAPAPLEIGEDSAQRSHVKIAVFSSFLQSGKSFAQRFGSYVKGQRDPLTFSQALISAGYNTGSNASGGTDNYANKLTAVILMVRKRLGCPQ